MSYVVVKKNTMYIHERKWRSKTRLSHFISKLPQLCLGELPGMNVDMFRFRNLVADLDSLQPRVFHYFLDRGTLLGIRLQHPSQQGPAGPRGKVVDGWRTS